MNKITLYRVNPKLSVENNTIINEDFKSQNPAGYGKKIQINFYITLTPSLKHLYQTLYIKPNGSAQMVNLFDYLNDLGKKELVVGNVYEITNLDDFDLDIPFDFNFLTINTTTKSVYFSDEDVNDVFLELDNINNYVEYGDFVGTIENGMVASINFLGNLYLNSLNIYQKLDADFYLNWLKNANDLTNQITVFLEGRNPLLEYNYLEVFRDSRVFYFFITGYTEVGNNQVIYNLKLDSLNTYFNDFNMRKIKGLILREHRDRFDYDESPIYDKEIEEIDVMPTIFTVEDYKPSRRVRLALRSFGGGFDGNDLLSRPNFYWEMYRNSSDSINVSGSNQKINLLIGWGVDLEEVNAYYEFYDSNDNYLFMLKSSNGSETVRFVKHPTNGEYYLQYGTTFGLNYIGSLIEDIANTDLVERIGNNLVFHYLKGSKNDNVAIKFKAVDSDDNYTILYDLGAISDQSFSSLTTRKKFGNKKSTYYIPFNNQIIRDATISKIVELPYSIPKATVLPDQADSPSYLEIMTDINMEVGLDQKFTILDKTFTIPNQINYAKIDNNDPKIYMSQFNPKFITWYNESILIRNESMNEDDFKFKVALDPSDYSKAKITNDGTDYETRSIHELTRTLDLNNTVLSVRNDLANYLDLLYENDLKLMQLQETQATKNLQKQKVDTFLKVGTAAVGGAVAGAAIGGIGAIPGAVIAGGSALFLGGINYSYALHKHNTDKAIREIDYENKIITLQSGLINITGSSPKLNELDNSDEIKLWSVALKESDKKYLDEYFHLYGYQTLKIDNLEYSFYTREKFNYVKAIIQNLDTHINLTIEVRNDILQRFEQGVTIFHYLSDLNEKIDFDQKYENREVSLL